MAQTPEGMEDYSAVYDVLDSEQSIEIILSAMQRLKDNSSLTIVEAIGLAIEEFNN